MLNVLGNKYRLCDGLSRRSFLKIGGLAMGGLSLPDVLRAESQQGRGASHKSVIMIFLSGGPPHQDMFDLKPLAPVEVRGEFDPILTNVPGIEICEHLPLMSQMTDRLAIIRSIVGAEGRHAAFQCMTGRVNSNQPQGGWPSFGSSVSKLQGLVNRGTPPFVGLSPRMKGKGWEDPGQPGFAGMAHAPFKPNADGKDNLVLNGLTLGQLGDRRSLLARLDNFKRTIDISGMMDGMDAFNEQAFGILTSSKLAEALDFEREDPALRDRYGRGSDKPAGYGDAGPLLNDYFLAARRLVETGVRVVTLAYGRWDWHGRPHGTNFENARNHLPMLDIGVTALLDDLKDRGLDKDVTVIVWGEFGRTPRINKKGGRDHWPRVSCALLSGGGLQTGQVIGATNRLGEHATKRPVHFQDVMATLYHSIGIDVNSATIRDLNGRPQYLVEHNLYQPLPELI
jgi:hypothetical protein